MTTKAPGIQGLLRMCNVPLAANLATAELLIGQLDGR